MKRLSRRQLSFFHLPQLLRNPLWGLALTLAAVAAPGVVSQESDAVSVFEEPNHHIIFTNDRVSVYRVDIQSQEDTHTLYHYHENDQLTVLTIDSSGFDQRLGEEAQRFEAPAGTLLFTSYSAVKSVPHQVSVPAGAQFGVVGVEFFAPASAQMEKRFSDPTEAQFDIPHAGVRRLQLEGEDGLEASTLLVSLGEYELNIEQQGGSVPWNANRGDVYWIDAQASGVKISTTQTAELIVIHLNPQ